MGPSNTRGILCVILSKATRMGSNGTGTVQHNSDLDQALDTFGRCIAKVDAIKKEK